jgi:hypothetical protein
MLDIDMPYFWRQGWVVFTSCFVPSGMLVRHLLLCRRTKIALRSCIATNLTMGAASWLFVVALPVAIMADYYAHVLILDRIPTGRADPISWIAVLVVSAVIAAVAEITALRIFFKRKLDRAAMSLLFVGALCCVAAAAYAMARYVLARPPIA